MLALLQTHCVSRVVTPKAGAYAAEDALMADKICQATKHISAHTALVDKAALLA